LSQSSPCACDSRHNERYVEPGDEGRRHAGGARTVLGASSAQVRSLGKAASSAAQTWDWTGPDALGDCPDSGIWGFRCAGIWIIVRSCGKAATRVSRGRQNRASTGPFVTTPTAHHPPPFSPAPNLPSRLSPRRQAGRGGRGVGRGRGWSVLCKRAAAEPDARRACEGRKLVIGGGACRHGRRRSLSDCRFSCRTCSTSNRGSR
jgi:hypothetical protein